MLPVEYRMGNYTPKGWVMRKALDAFGGYTNVGIKDNADRLFFDDRLERAIYAAIDAYEQLKGELK